jgi:hypothetical protein
MPTSACVTNSGELHLAATDELCYTTTVKWPWPPLRVGDVLGIAFVLAILGLFVVLTIGYPNFSRQATNSGFGPGWDCTSTGSGEPVCVKRTGAAK